MPQTPFKSCRSFRDALLVSILIGLQTPRDLRAEDKVAYKYQSYKEEEGRIQVDMQSASLDKDLDPAGKLHLKLHGVMDAIVGATPTGEPASTPNGPVPTARMVDRRKAWDAEFTRAYSSNSVSLSFSNSHESDYISNGVALNSTFDFNAANTQLLLGAGTSSDRVKAFFQADRLHKHSSSFIAGLSQILDPNTSVSINVNFGREAGYLSDPYRLILKDTEILPGLFLPLTFNENRPPQRDNWVLLAKLNRAVPSVKGAFEASFRAYRDNWGVRSATLEAAWYQNIGSKLILVPSVRVYRQGEADFYHLSLDGTSIIPTTVPSSQGPYYSSDYRLSKLGTHSLGMKVVWTPIERLQFDLAYERYEMRGRDGVTSAAAYPNANIVTLGFQRSW